MIFGDRQALRAAVAGLILACALWPNVAHAQETRSDSLEARVTRLEALVDSLLAELHRLPAERADAVVAAPAEVVDEEAELAALRAAAAAAAEAARPTAVTDTAGSQESRTRNLNVLNPEISVTGDLVGSFAAPEGGDSQVTAVPREFEFSFQSALDPYSGTKIFVTREEEIEIAGLEDVLSAGGTEEPGTDEPEEEGGGFELEEAYVYWVGLPVALKAGKFRHEIGLFNRWHTHALFEVERPLASVAFLGEDGLIQTGASLTLPSFGVGPATQTAWFEVAVADNALFDGGSDFSYLGRVQSFLDLSPSTYLQFGANGLYGRNDEVSLDSRLLSVDVAFRWAPPGRSLYRELTLKGEWYWAEKDFGDNEQTGNGGYAQANFRLDRRWIAGLRADYLDNFGTERSAFQLVPSLTWWQSEWLRLRLQYNFLKPESLSGNHSLLVQTVWSIGPHKHETY
jgi:hypothetical protein